MSEDAKAMTWTITILIASIGGLAWFSHARCYAQWEGTFPVRWGLIESCMIQVDGTWIPSANYREIAK